MHGKNITMQFNREVEAIYMLKKSVIIASFAEKKQEE